MGFILVTLFLLLILPGQKMQFLCQQNVIKSGGDIPGGSLAVETQLLIRCFQPYLGGADGGTDFPPGVKRLGEGDVEIAALLATRLDAAKLLAVITGGGN